MNSDLVYEKLPVNDGLISDDLNKLWHNSGKVYLILTDISP